jgi:glutamate racemase
MRKMKIGVFDSGLGGLFVMRALARKLPRYDYVYLGDTARVPYGNRSPQVVHQFLKEAMEFLFKQGCGLIIVACNTASAEALRKIQQGYLPRHYPDRRVLGVIIPTVEEALVSSVQRLGVLATQGTVRSDTYVREVQKLDPHVKVFQNAAPLLVPLIEHDGAKWATPIVREYLAPLRRAKVQKIILGCTHYPALKSMIKKISGVPVVSQDEIIPRKLKDYLRRHPEIDSRLGKGGKRELLATDITPAYERLAKKWFGKDARLKRIVL